MICGAKIDGAPCGRTIVPGFYLKWVHLENPGRDHHYAMPASRPTADDLAVLGSTPSRDARLSTEVPDKALAEGQTVSPHGLTL